jgi:hypothetical protein
MGAGSAPAAGWGEAARVAPERFHDLGYGQADRIWEATQAGLPAGIGWPEEFLP